MPACTKLGQILSLSRWTADYNKNELLWISKAALFCVINSLVYLEEQTSLLGKAARFLTACFQK